MDAIDGDEAADPDEEFAWPSVLAAVELLLCPMLPELEFALIEAVEFCSLPVEGVVELVLPLFIEPEELLPELFELFALKFEDVLLFVVSDPLALPLIEPDAAPDAL